MTHEVTQSQWIKIMGENPPGFRCGSYSKNTGGKVCPNHPIERVSYRDVQEFIEKLNDTLGLTGCDGTPDSARGCYRLPTEAEWEYSARGGTTTAYSSGNHHRWGFSFSDLEDYAWYFDNSDNKTHPVGLKKPNPYGLYDMHGNVGEWVQDKYTRNLPGGEDPLRIYGLNHVIRGGHWHSYFYRLRSADRRSAHPDMRAGYVGFRLVRTL